MNQNDKFNNVLNECLDRILKGETVEECLRSFPEEAARLRPLLMTALAAKKAANVQPSPEFKARARYEFQAALQGLERKPGHRKSFLSWHWQWQSGWAISLVVVLVIIVGGGGTVAASSNSMPDGPLYGVKLASEQAQLAVTPSDVGKTELNAKFADRRTDEIVYMATKGDAQQVQVLAGRLNNNLENITNITSGGSGQKSSGGKNEPSQSAPGFGASSASQSGQEPVMSAAGGAGTNSAPVLNAPPPALAPQPAAAPTPIPGNKVSPVPVTTVPAATSAPAAAPRTPVQPAASATSIPAVIPVAPAAVPAPSVNVTVSGNESAKADDKNRNSPNDTRTNNSKTNTQDTKQDKLRQIIIDNFNSRQARLEQALANASPPVRPAIRQAIAQSAAEFEKALQNLDHPGNSGK
jgi:hypothetical protein